MFEIVCVCALEIAYVIMNVLKNTWYHMCSGESNCCNLQKVNIRFLSMFKNMCLNKTYSVVVFVFIILGKT